jgi:hypothetical protein
MVTEQATIATKGPKAKQRRAGQEVIWVPDWQMRLIDHR